MRLLLDQGTPAPLRKHLRPHEVTTAAELGWAQLTNGELLTQAEGGGFDALITTDQNLKYQQKLAQRKIAVLALSTTSWPRIEKVVASILSAVESLKQGNYLELSIP